jgi:hypothetical protein
LNATKQSPSQPPSANPINPLITPQNSNPSLNGKQATTNVNNNLNSSSTNNKNSSASLQSNKDSNTSSNNLNKDNNLDPSNRNSVKDRVNELKLNFNPNQMSG